MKRLMALLLAVSLLGLVAGCVDGPSGQARHGGCAQGCGLHGPGCGGKCGGLHGNEAYNPGPPIGQVTYPYYTVRGPRDFLQRTPTPIGP
jgi:hypothetical protein